jgi:WD40 repeat protein
MRHYGPISGIAAHGGRWVATAGYDNRGILWEANSRQAVARGFHDYLVNNCAFNTRGNLLISASSDYTARIWAVPEMRLRMVLNGHHDDVEMAAFYPAEQRIATCSRDKTVCVYDIEGKLRRVLEGHQADVISVAWSTNGENLITSGDDGTVRCWDPETGKQKRIIDLQNVETDTAVIGIDGTIP